MTKSIWIVNITREIEGIVVAAETEDEALELALEVVGSGDYDRVQTMEFDADPVEKLTHLAPDELDIVPLGGDKPAREYFE